MSDRMDDNGNRSFFVLGHTLFRLFNPQSDRCFDVAIDHGFFNQPGFLTGIENIAAVVQTGWAKPGQSNTAPSEVIPGSVLSP